ncbi:hypothetical protein THF1C08_80122 [Vibrio jasicida]|uniref:Uncharacterized protein n=1 Tax=Vibrio jasicida TaxID=766224 RepID=A0AAU9QYR4_9VIBR|nr:hypothetical protein THF1C08_80122 [Vibrio jasicida]CAH1603401.1 hypothetical protein THF1A12_70120 [Vibrio jasicida]
MPLSYLPRPLSYCVFSPVQSNEFRTLQSYQVAQQQPCYASINYPVVIDAIYMPFKERRLVHILVDNCALTHFFADSCDKKVNFKLYILRGWQKDFAILTKVCRNTK